MGNSVALPCAQQREGEEEVGGILMADAATLGSPKDQKNEVGGILMADDATLGSPKDQRSIGKFSWKKSEASLWPMLLP